MDKDLIARLIQDIVGEANVRVDEPMKNHTSFKLGGPADIFVVPQNIESITSIINLCREKNVPIFVMGNGSNLVVRDKGIRGVVIKICENMNSFTVTDSLIEADAGILLSKVSNMALEHGLSGLEFASGIPGTLGGAVTMNAGAYGGEMKDVVIKTVFIDKNGDIGELYGEEHQFGYRSSAIQKRGAIVLKSQMKLKKGDKAEIKALMDDLTKKRTEKQPLEMPSAGSVFKRPEGYFTGKLVEDCGLKGYRYGGAEVSCKHCGFIVNAGGATASDVIGLIRHIQQTVESKYGVKLETEVKIVGEE